MTNLNDNYFMLILAISIVSIGGISFAGGWFSAPRTDVIVVQDNFNISSCRYEVHDPTGYGHSIRLWNLSYFNYGECNRLKDVCQKQDSCRDMGALCPFKSVDNLDCRWIEPDICTCMINLVK